MPMATIHKVGSGELYHIHFLDQRTDPGFGVGGGADPGFGQGHPRPDRPDAGLPGSGAHPGNRPPGSGGGGIPDNELPDSPPPQLAPGWTLVLVRGPQGKWQYAAMAPGSPPPRPLPPSSGRPDNTLPGQGQPPHVGGIVPPGTEHPGGGPMPTPPPTAGTPLPPTAQPR